MEWNTPNKNAIRTDLFNNLVTDKPFECALMVPSEDCLCVKEGIKQGKINEDTEIVAIEKNGPSIPRLEKNLKKLGIKSFLVRQKRIEDLDLRYDFPHHKFDFVYLDSCGCYSCDIRKKLSDVIFPKCTDNANVAFTFVNRKAGPSASDRCDWDSHCNDKLQQVFIDSVIEKVTPKNPKYETKINLKEILYTVVNDIRMTNLEKLWFSWARTYKRINVRCDPMATFLFNDNPSYSNNIDVGSKETVNMGYQYA